MRGKELKKRISYGCFRILRGLVWLFYPKMTVEGMENFPGEPCIFVGNHSQMHGPIGCELYFPGKPYTWCAGQMMHLRDVPAYAYQDFWSGKPKSVRWFYRLLSYLIAPLSVCVFGNARTIGVYRDTRILSTFRNTVGKLTAGTNVVVFPECYTPHNAIVYLFQDRFIDVARLYYKQTGKCLPFVPLYIAPNLKKMYLGKPICYDPNGDSADKRLEIRDYLMEQITQMARSLPEHRVVPYPNVPKKKYPSNLDMLEVIHEETCC